LAPRTIGQKIAASLGLCLVLVFVVCSSALVNTGSAQRECSRNFKKSGFQPDFHLQLTAAACSEGIFRFVLHHLFCHRRDSRALLAACADSVTHHIIVTLICARVYFIFNIMIYRGVLKITREKTVRMDVTGFIQNSDFNI